MDFTKMVIVTVVSIVLIGSLVIPVVGLYGDDQPVILDVLVIDGQSNAEYGGLGECNPVVLNEEYDEVPQHNILYYGTSKKPCNHWDWVVDWNSSWTAFHIYNAYDYQNEQWKIGGYEPILANTISKESGHDVLVVNMSIGARTIEQLLPDGEDGAYSWGVLQHALDQAKKDYDALNMIGVVWIQGESDKDTPVDDYEDSFVELMDSFDEYGLDEFYLVHTREYYGGNSNIAQEELSEDYSNVQIVTYITDTFTVENGMLNPDAPIHYSQKGRDAISFDIADKIVIPEYNHDSSNIYSSLVSMIPILLIVGVIVVVIGTFVYRRI